LWKIILAGMVAAPRLPRDRQHRLRNTAEPPADIDTVHANLASLP